MGIKKQLTMYTASMIHEKATDYNKMFDFATEFGPLRKKHKCKKKMKLAPQKRGDGIIWRCGTKKCLK